MGKSSSGVAVSCAIGVVVLFSLGVYRLELGRTQDDMGEANSAVIGSCFPRVDVPAGIAVAAGSYASFQGEASPLLVGETAASPKSGLAVRAAGPVEIHLTAPLAAEGESMPLEGKSIVLRKSSAPLELFPRAAGVLVHQGNALIRVESPARFELADDTPYEIKFDEAKPAHAVVSHGKAVIPVGTNIGDLPTGSVVNVIPIQPVRGKVWPKNPIPSLSLTRISGQAGLSDVSIESGRSGLKLTQGESTVYACVTKQSAPGDWIPAPVTQQPTSSGSSGRMSIGLPSEALPPDTSGVTPIWLAVATADGQSMAVGGIKFVGRLRAGIFATILTASLLAPLMRFRGRRVAKSSSDSRWFAGLFLNEDGDPSLSLLQILIWTTITIWGFFYVFIVAGNLLAMTPEMMSLLGIAGVGTVISRWITTANAVTNEPIGKPSQRMDGDQAGNDFWRMLSTSGHFDLLKLQLFAFTVVIALYVAWRIADAAAFPVLDTNTLLLLGVSQGVYVTGKMAAATDLKSVKTTAALLALKSKQVEATIADKDVLDKELLGLQANAVRTAAENQRMADLPALIATAAQQLAALTAEQKALSDAYDAGLAKLDLKRA